MADKRSLNRRDFLKASTATAGAFAAPYFVPSRAFGANERIVTGHIGVGGRGGSDMRGFLSASCDVAAVCDVDAKHRERALKLATSRGMKCEGYGDYRQLLDRSDIDAVVVATPDHWHALPTIEACNAGKDVFCEKPLSLTIAEGRKMVEAARRNKRIVQTGTQNRSSRNFRYACELVRSGYLGELQEIQVGIAHVKFWFFEKGGKVRADVGERIPDSDPPPELDYDFWLGPAPYRPYNMNQVHYNYRWFWDYGGGQMTNWGAHNIDIAQWALDADNSGPVTTEGTATYLGGDLYECPSTSMVTHTYANGVKLVIGQWRENDPERKFPDGSNIFVGTKGKLLVTRGELKSDPAELIETPIGSNDVHLYRSTNHIGNFLDCIKSRELPVSDVEYGHRSATVCHLGNIAVRVGRTIRWDPVAERIEGDEEASALVDKPYRAPWKLPA